MLQDGHGGPRPGAGRRKGTGYKTAARLKASAANMEQAVANGHVIAVDRLRQFMPHLAGLVSHFQPTYPGMPHQNPHGDARQFQRWLELLIVLARSLAPYETPRLAAIMVNQTSTPLAAALEMMLAEIDQQGRAQERKQQVIEHRPQEGAPT